MWSIFHNEIITKAIIFANIPHKLFIPYQPFHNIIIYISELKAVNTKKDPEISQRLSPLVYIIFTGFPTGLHSVWSDYSEFRKCIPLFILTDHPQTRPWVSPNHFSPIGPDIVGCGGCIPRTQLELSLKIALPDMVANQRYSFQIAQVEEIDNSLT